MPQVECIADCLLTSDSIVHSPLAVVASIYPGWRSLHSQRCSQLVALQVTGLNQSTQWTFLTEILITIWALLFNKITNCLFLINCGPVVLVKVSCRGSQFSKEMLNKTEK